MNYKTILELKSTGLGEGVEMGVRIMSGHLNRRPGGMGMVTCGVLDENWVQQLHFILSML